MTDGVAKRGGIIHAAMPDRVNTVFRTIGIAIAGSAFVAICAHISLPLLFSPVPITMQPFAVLLLGLLLGPGTAFVTLSLYLFEGAMGLPVFTPHGIGGTAQLLGFTGGYLLSYPFVAALVSWLSHVGNPSFSRRAWSAAAGNVLILVCGSAWFAVLSHVNLRTLMNTSVIPFLPGDTLKVIAAAAFATAWRSGQLYKQKSQVN